MIGPQVNIKIIIFALGIIIGAPSWVIGQTPEELSVYTGITLPPITTIPGAIVLKTRANQGFNIQAVDSIGTKAYEMGAKSVRKLPPPPGEKTPFGGGSSTYVMEFPPTANIPQIITTLSQRTNIDYVEPVYIVQLFYNPNDPNFSKQTYISDSQLGEILALPANHDVIIAVIDTGVDSGHVDLKDHLIGGVNFLNTESPPNDEHGHGTHIAGIIGAHINNQMGIAGLNPKSKIMSLKIAGSNGIGSQVAAAEAIRYAVDNGARLINCSWGYFVYNQILKDAVEYAISKGVVVVAAMGNNGSPLKQYPAGFSGVIAVGSMDSTHQRASFSNTGEHIRFLAEGVNILSLAPGGGTLALSGTSQSTAIITGIISRIFSYNPQLSAHDVGTLMMLSAEPLGDGQRTSESGYGYVQVEKLFLALNAPSANGFIGENGVIDKEFKPKNSAPASEPFWLSILLIPYRIIEFFIGGLI